MSQGNNDPRFTEVQLGIEVEAFLNGAVGKYLASRAEDEAQTALELLATVPPDGEAEIRKLQNQHWRASTVMSWLVEAIEVGAHAEAELTAEE